LQKNGRHKTSWERIVYGANRPGFKPIVVWAIRPRGESTMGQIVRWAKRLETPLSCLYLTIVISYCLDYRNSTIATLQRIQNAAARMVLNLRHRDSISDGLRQLHWHPVESRIQFKLCLLMHLIHTGRYPSYISDNDVQLVADHVSRTGLRSASISRHILPRLRTIFEGARLFVLWPQGLVFASGSISFD